MNRDRWPWSDCDCLSYGECVSNDFTPSEGGRKLELLRRDIGDWRITFVDNGAERQYQPK